jgi:hypothetical protein
MFAGVQRARFLPEHGDDVIRVAQQSLDTLREMPGLQRMTYLYDRASGWGFAISLWTSEGDARAVGERLTDIRDQFAPYWAGDIGSAVHDVTGTLPSFEVIAET